jgi:glucose-6-phosphate 1-dehydrogenase
MDAHVVRAQYAAGSIAGKKVPGYREEPGVSRNSQTETYVAMKFFIDSWRWAGVPFYLRSGKRMPKRVTEIAIHFKEAPHLLFGKRGEGIKPNVLAIRIQPDEGITLNFGSKLPGPAMEVAPVSMEFRYGSSFGVEPPEAYERLILDCLLGDNTLFTRADEVEASWTWISRIHQHWAEQSAMGNAQLATYAAGSWGPEAAERLLAADHRAWRRP